MSEFLKSKLDIDEFNKRMRSKVNSHDFDVCISLIYITVLFLIHTYLETKSKSTWPRKVDKNNCSNAYLRAKKRVQKSVGIKGIIDICRLTNQKQSWEF